MFLACYHTIWYNNSTFIHRISTSTVRHYIYQPARQTTTKSDKKTRFFGKFYLAEVCGIVWHILAFSLLKLFRKMTNFGPPSSHQPGSWLQTRLGQSWQLTAQVHQLSALQGKTREVIKPGNCSDIDNHIKAEVRHY